MGYSAPNVDDAMLALQVANFETAQQAVEQATPKADQRKVNYYVFMKNYTYNVHENFHCHFRFPWITSSICAFSKRDFDPKSKTKEK